MTDSDEKFQERIKAWGGNNPWFSNPQTDLELQMAVDAMHLHTRITQEHGVPTTEQGVNQYLGLIDAGIREAYPEYAWGNK